MARLDCAGPCDVVEFGCGYGSFTVPTAKLVCGTVFAFDIDPSMVEATSRRIAAAGVTNVRLEQRDFMTVGCGRPDRSVGYAMLFNILHIEEPRHLLAEAFRVLGPGGKLGVIHWKHDPDTPRGPSLPIRPRPDQCRAWAEEVGFRFVREQDLCCCSWHWGMVLERPG